MKIYFDKRWSVYVFMLVLVFVAGCGGSVDLLARPTVTIPTSTVGSTVAPMAMIESTKTTKPTITNTPEPTLTPTQVFSATPTRGSRVWTRQQFGWFMSHVGGWFLAPDNVPILPREGDPIAQLLDQFNYDRSVDSWVGPVDASTIDPDAVCDWALRKLQEGYTLLIVQEGKVFQDVTFEVRWAQFSRAVGDPGKEPYCPQFDKSLSPISDD